MRDVPARRFVCARCHVPVLVCSHCDRGQVYCAAGCSATARRQSQRDAGRRYQDSLPGRFHHAARTQRWRVRQAALAMSTAAVVRWDARHSGHEANVPPPARRRYHATAVTGQPRRSLNP